MSDQPNPLVSIDQDTLKTLINGALLAYRRHLPPPNPADRRRTRGSQEIMQIGHAINAAAKLLDTLSTFSPLDEDPDFIKAEVFYDGKFMGAVFNIHPLLETWHDANLFECFSRGMALSYPPDNLAELGKFVDLESLYRQMLSVSADPETFRGFDVHVDATDAFRWLKKHKPDVWGAINSGQNLLDYRKSKESSSTTS